MTEPYLELHVQSAFSFLQGSSLPEDLVHRASELGYPALALMDRNGVYGAPRFYKACREAGIRPLVGAEVTVRIGSQPAQLPLLVENRTGYQNLCRLITRLRLRAKKGEGIAELREVEEFSCGLVALTGGGEGPLYQALLRDRWEEASSLLDQLAGIFRARLWIEIQRQFDRPQEQANQALRRLSETRRVPLLATNGVRYARSENRPLLDVFTCIRHKTNLREAGKLLSLNAECYLKSPEAMRALFSDLPGAIAATTELADRLEFTLENLGYRFPDYPVPSGGSMIQYLRSLTEAGARRRYRPYHARARAQINRELELIEKLELAGYFLIVWDLVRFCRENDILVQGRGSAANSAVCYSLGITAVDPVGMDLLFERFLSEERGEWPDIDLDLPSGDRRERVIQYVYERYGRLGAAMTANVITYRGKSAAREVGKALEIPEEKVDRLSRMLIGFLHGDMQQMPGDALPGGKAFQEAGFDLSDPPIRLFRKLWVQMQDLPRHLGQHSGGMVIAQDGLDAVVPLENAAMPGRKVVQWDKEDCADMGIIKVDLLGLGMMSVLQDSLQLIRETGGEEVDLARLPPDDPQVYRMLQKADTVGVFQVESRAQMATLPRLKPRCFYDLVVEVALIRPGPIVGQMVHPYLKRRNGEEEVVYDHPSLEPILKRTLGVPLFQEQLLRMAMAAAGFTGGEAEELRRTLGAKRSVEKMKKVEVKLREGIRAKGIGNEAAERIILSITSFALYGFPESHAASFALLAYASAYLKCHYPAAFYTGLLNNQPMGFYHPATLVKDAQHRGQRIKPIDVTKSDWLCRIEPDGSIRLGLLYVAGLRQEAGVSIEEERKRSAFLSAEDMQIRTGLRRNEMTVLAEIGALNSLGMHRREALWQVEKACRPSGPLFRQRSEKDPSPLEEMTAGERLLADYRGTGLTLGPHPVAYRREELSRQGVFRATDLPHLRDGRRVRVAGGVIVRQRPGTARGFFFVSLEDETGISNIVVHPRLFEREKTILVSVPFLIVEGIVQNQNGVTAVRAVRFQPLDVFQLEVSSHSFM